MRQLTYFGAIVATYVASMMPAHAVFNGEVPVPEPGSLGLLAAGGVAIMAVRYLNKRRGDK